MPTTEFLLRTKFHFPPVRSKFIARPRLIELLNKGLTGHLTLISAPAGFGKTSLLGEWRRSRFGRELPVAWLSLDSDDNELTQFLTYLSAGLSSINAALGESALTLLQSPQPPPVNSVLTTLINDLSTLQSPAALVLDDYHVIHSEAVHQAVMFLLDHLPDQMHLAILTRSDPPLPLARLRARGQLIEIRAEDLRFTYEEVASFLEQVMNLALSPADITTLETRTEGWIAGLQMAALSMQGRADASRFIQEFSGSHRYILDYLAEEVLNRQPESVQHFLMVTSILERFCAALCSELINESEASARETLGYLDRVNLFLVALDDERCWYRYHHLFAVLILPGSINATRMPNGLSS